MKVFVANGYFDVAANLGLDPALQRNVSLAY